MLAEQPWGNTRGQGPYPGAQDLKEAPQPLHHPHTHTHTHTHTQGTFLFSLPDTWRADKETIRERYQGLCTMALQLQPRPFFSSVPVWAWEVKVMLLKEREYQKSAHDSSFHLWIKQGVNVNNFGVYWLTLRYTWNEPVKQKISQIQKQLWL